MDSTRIVLALSCALLPIMATGALSQNKSQSMSRQRLNFNDNWRFHLGDFNDNKPLGNGDTIESWRFKSGDDAADLSTNTGLKNGAVLIKEKR